MKDLTKGRYPRNKDSKYQWLRYAKDGLLYWHLLSRTNMGQRYQMSTCIFEDYPRWMMAESLKKLRQQRRLK